MPISSKRRGKRERRKARNKDNQTALERLDLVVQEQQQAAGSKKPSTANQQSSDTELLTSEIAPGTASFESICAAAA
jgi:hypothetical protein